MLSIAEQGRGDLLSLEQEHVIAVDSILIIVSPGNPVDALTMDQAGRIFSGEITNWAEVGGPDTPISVYTRSEASGTRGVFTGQVLRPIEAEMAADAVVVGGNREMADKVVADAGGIGYVGFASLRDAKPLDLVAQCGIKMKATTFGAKTEEYPLERRLRLFVDNRPLPDMAGELIAFAESSAADGLVRKAGFIDLGVEVASAGLDRDRLMEAALASEDAVALRLLRTMMLELGEAERLSTTFRFNPGSVELDNKAQRDVSRVIEFLARPEHAGRELVFVGFTDADGSFQANAALSEGRAAVAMEAVRNHPDFAKLSGFRMRALGFGELAPVGCNETFDGRKRNRRVELWLN
ncbi:MAG: phosphate ABC transporter substrate-binding/OmpA family protein [Pseudomonadota bacterium]